MKGLRLKFYLYRRRKYKAQDNLDIKLKKYLKKEEVSSLKLVQMMGYISRIHSI